MMITSFKIFRYSLPLIRPLFFHGIEKYTLAGTSKTCPTAKIVVSHRRRRFSFGEKIPVREGLILKLLLDGEIQGFGEIAPLPGWSAAGIDACIKNLREVCAALMMERFSGGFPCLGDDFFEKLDKIRMYPEVRFGLEMAVLNASASQRQMPLNKFLSEHTADKIILNGLLPDSNDPLEQQVQRLLQKGYTLIKVKVEGNVREDIKRVTAAVNAADHRAHVHVDVNQKWSFEDAILFSEKMRGYPIKYIEEPFSDTAKIPDFFKKTGMPVALDESLVSRGFAGLTYEGIKFLVLKPMLLGGIRKTLQIMHDAAGKGIQSIISSSFESDIGILTLSHLAASGGEDVTAGLDTLKWFERGLLKEPQSIYEGKITVAGRNVLENDIRTEYLAVV